MSNNTIDKTTLSIIDIINKVIVIELHGLIYPNDKNSPDVFIQTSAYIKFIPIISCIEFLGACYDELPFDTSRLDKQDIVETRFNIAIKKLFEGKYLKFTKADSKFYFYKNIRCAMIHQLKPGPGIFFTTRKESIEDKTRHLVPDKDGHLIIVLEDLYDDLNKAAKKLIKLFQTKKVTNKKGDLAFLNIKSY